MANPSKATAHHGARRHDEEDVLHILSQSGFIQFHPALADGLGFKAALFLGHALYWSRYLAKNQPMRNGWFYMTASQWEEATGLTAREQTSVRELLVREQLLSEKVAGKPPCLHYRADLSRLAHWAGLHADGDGHVEITWETFAPWLKGAINFYRPLARIAGSVAAGLYLSYLIRAQYTIVRASGVRFGLEKEGYFKISHEDVRIALCFGSKTQRNARAKLKALGFLHECGNLSRIDLQALQDALNGTGIGDLQREHRPKLQLVTFTQAPSTSDLNVAVRWLADHQHATEPARQSQLQLFDRWLTNTPEGQQATQSVTRMFASTAASGQHLAQPTQDKAAPHSGDWCQPFALSSKSKPAVLSNSGLEAAENANCDCPFVEPNLPFCRSHINNKTNNLRLPARAGEHGSNFDKTAGRRRISEISARQPDDPPVQSQDELLLPKALSPDWHDAVRKTLCGAPQAMRQQLLDELEGQLNIGGKIINNPPGYLYSLIRKHKSGNLVFAMADQVAASRRDRQRAQATVDNALRLPSRPESKAVTNESQNLSPVALVEGERIKKLLQQWGFRKGVPT